jgi:hypothetical protein
MQTTQQFMREREAPARYREEIGQRRGAHAVRKMVEAAVVEEIEREMIGDYWISPHGEPAGDGRRKYGIYDPAGGLHGYVWGKSAAEAACNQLITEGQITR